MNDKNSTISKKMSLEFYVQDKKQSYPVLKFEL